MDAPEARGSRAGPEGGVRRKRGRRDKWSKGLRGWLWFLGAVIVVTVLLPRWAEGLVRGWFVPTVTPRPGPLEIVERREALALWRETVVEAPTSGAVRFLVEDGTRVQAGEAVAVLGEGMGTWRPAAARPGVVAAPTAGVVRFDWRGPPRPEPEEALLWADSVLREIGSIQHRVGSGRVRAGDLLFRLVDNHRAYLLVPWEGGPPIGVGERVWIRSPASPPEGQAAAAPRDRGQRPVLNWPAGQEVGAEVVATRPVPTGSQGDALLLRLDRWPPGWEMLDWIEVELVVKRFEGLIVPAHLLVERGGRTGVYVQGRSGPIFHPVSVQGAVGNRVAVKGLAPGVAIIADVPAAEGGR